MKIKNKEIGPHQPPYIVSELSGNHCGVFEQAIKLLDAAKKTGANAAKLQCYEPDEITIDHNSSDFIIKSGPWAGRKLFELYQKAHTPRTWFPELFSYAEEIGIDVFASVFSPKGVDFLEKLDCPCYKIASMELVDIPLIQYAAKTGKPLIISTGMASQVEIVQAGNATNPSLDVAWLACVSGYPTPIADAGLDRFISLYSKYGVYGISDHTVGYSVPIAATALGAQIIEKHLMLDPWEYGSENPEDFAFSMRPAEFQEMCIQVQAIWRAMQPHEVASEESSRQARRSLYVVKSVKKGEIFTEENIRSIRPCYGLPPKELPNVLGKKAARDISFGTALAWNLVDQT